MTDAELSEKADSLIAFIEQEKLAVYGLEIWNKSSLVKSWGNTKDRFPIYSITKSIVSLAFGLAEAEGVISMNAPLADYLPAEYLNTLSLEKRSVFEALPLERLLTMSIPGLPFRPEGDNWLTFCAGLDYPLKERGFCYSNVNAYLVAVALENALKRPLYDYLSEKLFAPLGIEKPPYQTSPEGHFCGASGVQMSVSELSRIGRMLMNGGRSDGKQIVPEAYVSRATGVQQMNREGGYGYFFWKFLDGFSLNGKWGQKCYCLPERGIMVTFLSNLPDGTGKLKNEVISLCSRQLVAGRTTVRHRT